LIGGREVNDAQVSANGLPAGLRIQKKLSSDNDFGLPMRCNKW
jgi:hypothetical protein